MKQFLKFTFASMMGFILSIGVIIILFIGTITVIASATKDEIVEIKENSILHLKLNGPIADKAPENPLEEIDFMNLSATSPLSLNKILSSIKAAKEDNKIKGIYMELSSFGSGFATLEEIREALLDFKSSGKTITCYSEVYSQKTYYLGSIADKLYLNPEGVLDFRGLNASVIFFKNALNKIGIEPQILRHGKFKSAVEPFLLEEMSEENKKQTKVYLTSTWQHYVHGIATQRNIPIDLLNNYADSYSIQNAKDAYALNMVDSLVYKDQILTELAQFSNTESINKLPFISLKKYSKSSAVRKPAVTRDQIAVLFASGDIVSGNTSGKIASENLSEEIRKLRLNEHVKAIVLRVNSPGGSALASEVIWREVFLAKQTKPVVVSMGDVAASGGYYIACAADKIIANPTTITGSIGVFGLMFNTQELLNEKLGITIDNVKTHQFADLGSFHRPFKPEERAIMQQGVENTYQTFISRVAEGRDMTTDQVDSIGQGRIWTGIDALKIGLVDELGGLQKAILSAVELAEIKEYRIVNYPKEKEPFEAIMEILGQDLQSYTAKAILGDKYQQFQQLDYISNTEGIQARIPFILSIN